MLHVFALDRVEPLVSQRRHQVHAEDHLLRRNPARFLPIRPRVAVHESRPKRFKCRHLPFWALVSSGGGRISCWVPLPAPYRRPSDHPCRDLRPRLDARPGTGEPAAGAPALRRGARLDGVEYVDRGVSGAKDRRPALDRSGTGRAAPAVRCAGVLAAGSARSEPEAPDHAARGAAGARRGVRQSGRRASTPRRRPASCRCTSSARSRSSSGNGFENGCWRACSEPERREETRPTKESSGGDRRPWRFGESGGESVGGVEEYDGSVD